MSETAIIYDKATGDIVEVRTASPSLPAQLPNVDAIRQRVVRVGKNHPAIHNQSEWRGQGASLEKRRPL